MAYSRFLSLGVSQAKQFAGRDPVADIKKKIVCINLFMRKDLKRHVVVVVYSCRVKLAHYCRGYLAVELISVPANLTESHAAAGMDYGRFTNLLPENLRFECIAIFL